MEVNVQIERAAEALDQRDRARVGRLGMVVPAQTDCVNASIGNCPVRFKGSFTCLRILRPLQLCA